jgi:hypothetical protein
MALRAARRGGSKKAREDYHLKSTASGVRECEARAFEPASCSKPSSDAAKYTCHSPTTAKFVYPNQDGTPRPDLVDKHLLHF